MKSNPMVKKMQSSMLGHTVLLRRSGKGVGDRIARRPG